MLAVATQKPLNPSIISLPRLITKEKQGEGRKKETELAMALYLLYESASGYGLFHAHGLDEIGQNTEAVRNSVKDLNRFGKVVKLVAFNPFESALDALNQCNAVSEGRIENINLCKSKK